MRFGRVRQGAIVGPAIVCCLFESRLLIGVAKQAARTGARLLLAAHFADPPLQLVGIKVPIARIGKGGTCATLKCEQSSVRTLRGAAWVPGTGDGAEAFRQSAGQEAHDVDLMGSLAKDDTAALR